MSALPVSRATDTLDERVARLLAQWRKDTAFVSSSSKMQAHPAYQEISRLGKPALPALFRDLERTLDGHLANALTAITGANPVPVEFQGRIAEIARVWVQWARENGIQW